MGWRWIIETAVSIFLFFSLYQITDLHTRHKRTLFCRELLLVSLSCPQKFTWDFKKYLGVLWPDIVAFSEMDICFFSISGALENQLDMIMGKWTEIFVLGASGMNAEQYPMLFSNFWRHELCFCAAFFIDSAQLTLVNYTVDKIWDKAHIWN